MSIHNDGEQQVEKASRSRAGQGADAAFVDASSYMMFTQSNDRTYDNAMMNNKQMMFDHTAVSPGLSTVKNKSVSQVKKQLQNIINDSGIDATSRRSNQQ